MLGDRQAFASSSWFENSSLVRTFLNRWPLTLSASMVWLASEQRASYFSEAASVCCTHRHVYRNITVNIKSLLWGELSYAGE